MKSMFYNYFNDFLDYLANERNYSNLTIKSYKEDLIQFQEFILGKELQSIKQIDHIIIRSFLSILVDKNYSKKSVLRKLAAIKSFFKFLFNRGILENNPGDYVSSPKSEKILPDFLYEDEMTELIETQTDENFSSIRNKALLEVLYSTGIRVSELVSIDVNDIDFQTGLIKVRGKGNKERIVALGSMSISALHHYLSFRNAHIEKNHKENSALFLNHFGDRLTDRGVRYIFEKIVKKIALNKKVSPHTIRHTFATHMLNHGCDLRVVQEFLGHVSLSTTQIYTHIESEKLKKVYKECHPHS